MSKFLTDLRTAHKCWFMRILQLVSDLTHCLHPSLRTYSVPGHSDEVPAESTILEIATHMGQAAVSNNGGGAGRCCGLERTLHCVRMGEVEADSGTSSHLPW